MLFTIFFKRIRALCHILGSTFRPNVTYDSSQYCLSNQCLSPLLQQLINFDINSWGARMDFHVSICTHFDYFCFDNALQLRFSSSFKQIIFQIVRARIDFHVFIFIFCIFVDNIAFQLRFIRLSVYDIRPNLTSNLIEFRLVETFLTFVFLPPSFPLPSPTTSAPKECFHDRQRRSKTKT